MTMPGTCYFCGEEAVKVMELKNGMVVPEDGWRGRWMFVGDPPRKVVVCRECFHHPDRRKKFAEKRREDLAGKVSTVGS